MLLPYIFTLIREIIEVYLNFRKLFSMAAVVLAIVATGLAVLHPAANAFALMTLGLPAFFLLIHELKR
jgi:alkaline ceramidase